MQAAMGAAGWQAWTVTNVVMDIVFIVDIILSFRTGFFVDGKFVTDSKHILARLDDERVGLVDRAKRAQRQATDAHPGDAPGCGRADPDPVPDPDPPQTG